MSLLAALLFYWRWLFSALRILLGELFLFSFQEGVLILPYRMGLFYSVITLCYNQQMSNKSRSEDKDQDPYLRKIFITNLNGEKDVDELQSTLRNLFMEYGKITKLNVKKNKNGHYGFAFLEFTDPESVTKAVRELDQREIFGRNMKVRQDKQSQGCFNCKKHGHYAKQCPQKVFRFMETNRYDHGHQEPRDKYSWNQRYEHREREREGREREGRGYENDYYDSPRDRHHRKHHHRHHRRSSSSHSNRNHRERDESPRRRKAYYQDRYEGRRDRYEDYYNNNNNNNWYDRYEGRDYERKRHYQKAPRDYSHNRKQSRRSSSSRR